MFERYEPYGSDDLMNYYTVAVSKFNNLIHQISLAKYVDVLLQNEVNKIFLVLHLKTYLEYSTCLFPLKHDYKNVCFRGGMEPEQYGVLVI